MNKKKVLVWLFVITTIVAFVCFIFWFLWRGLGGAPVQKNDFGSATTSTFGDARGCVVWQSDDSTKPCFHPATPISTSTKTSLPAAVSKCDGLSEIETDECVSTIAIETKSKDLCDVLTNAEARKVCLGGQAVDSVDRKIVDVKIPSLVPDGPVSVKNSSTTSLVDMNSFVQTEIAKQVAKSKEVVLNQDPKTTAVGFYDRLASKAPFNLFQVTPYQVRPGDTVVVQGMGFQKEGNVLHFENNPSLPVGSVDGMTFNAVVPSSLPEGECEVYVTNSRGSSQNSARPIKVMVTNNPKPLPKITDIKPTVVAPNGSITIEGENMSGLQGVYTSLGWVLGSSNSVALSSFQFLKNFTESKYTKSGSKFKFAAYVKTDAGMSEEPFFFEVQF